MGVRRSPVIAVLAAAALAGCGDEAAERRAADDAPSDFTPLVDDPRTAADGRYLVARVQRRTALRSRPGGGRVVARIGRRTEFGSPRVLSVVSRRDRWLEVIATERRNGRTGWVRAGATRLSGTDFAIEVDRSRRRVRLLRADEVLRSFAVAVGRPGNETPLGRFAVTDKLHPEAPGSVYGCCAVALSGHQTKLVPGWPGGDRLAIHATPAKWSIGQAASLGCLRARDRDVRALMRRVPLGTPVFVKA